MSKEKIETKKGVTILTNKLGKFERLHVEELRVLTNHAVQGLGPVTVVEKWGKVILRVEQRGWTPLTAYFRAGMNADTLLLFICNTLQIVRDSERYGLRVDSFSWDPDRVFVDSYGNLFMVYWPMISLTPAPLTALNFYHSFCDALEKSEMPRAISNPYFAYFYQRNYLDLPQFHEMVMGIAAAWRHEKHRRQTPPTPPELQPDKSYRVVYNGWLERPHEGVKIPLSHKKSTLGRDPARCNVEITGFSGVSQTHAEIIHKDGQYFLKDLKSTNGTYIKGIRQKPGIAILLHDGDTVRFGNATYVFRQRDNNDTVSIYDINRS